LESIASPDAELIKAINIGDVLEAIIRQRSVPREAEFHLKRRANTMLNNYNKILLEDSTASKAQNTKWDISNAPARDGGLVAPPTNTPLKDPFKATKLKWLREAMSHLNTVQSEYISNPKVHSAIVGILEDYNKGVFDQNLLIKKCLHIFSAPPLMRVGGFKAKTILPNSLVIQTEGSRGSGLKDIESGSTVAGASPAVKPKGDIATDLMRTKSPEQILPAPGQCEERQLTPMHHPRDSLLAPRTPTKTKLPEPRSAPIASMVPRTGDISHISMSEKARGKQRMVLRVDDASETVMADRGSPSRKNMGQNITRFLTLNQGVPPASEEEERRKQLEADEALAKELALTWGSSQVHERDDEEVARHLQERYNTGIYDSENDIGVTPLRVSSVGNEPHPEINGQGRTMLNQDTEMVDAPPPPEKIQGDKSDRGYLAGDGEDVGDIEGGPYAGTRNHDQAPIAQSKLTPITQEIPAAQGTNGSHLKGSLSLQGEGGATANPQESDDGIEIVSARPVLTKIPDWDSPPHERRKRQPLSRPRRQQVVSKLHTKDANVATVTQLQSAVSTIPDDDDDDDPPRKSVRRPRAHVEDAGYPPLGLQSVRSHFKGRHPLHCDEASDEDEADLIDGGPLGLPKIETQDERVSSHTASPTPFRPKIADQVARIKEERAQNATWTQSYDSNGATDTRQPQHVPPRTSANVSVTMADIAVKSASLALNTSDLLKILDENFPLNRSSAPDNPVFFSRIGISHVIGPGHMTTFVPLKPEALNAYQTQKAVFIKKSLNPFSPSSAMKHGIMFTMRKHEWKEGESALLFCHRQGPDWEYVGTYEMESWTMMMKDEWSSMPDRFRRQWAKHIKSSYKDGWSTLLLEEAGFLREPHQEFSWEDVMDLFFRVRP
jgi:hypothetical protein